MLEKSELFPIVFGKLHHSVPRNPVPDPWVYNKYRYATLYCNMNNYKTKRMVCFHKKYLNISFLCSRYGSLSSYRKKDNATDVDMYYAYAWFTLGGGGRYGLCKDCLLPTVKYSPRCGLIHFRLSHTVW
jgi:hypothetical protein